MIKAILLDIDNTLLDFNLNAKHSMGCAMEDCGIKYRDEYFPVFTRVNNALWENIEKKVIHREYLKENRFRLVLKELSLDGDGVRVEEIFRKYLHDFAFPIGGAKELLEYLSKKYKLYAASNAMYTQQVSRLTKANIIGYFEKLFISEAIGHDKPTSSYFDYCFLNMGGISPDQAVMIGDSLSADIGGAKKYGMTTIWFNNGGKNPDRSEFADFTVTDLLDITKIL